MPNRSHDERSVRSLTQSSAGSYLVTIPVEYIKSLNWKAKQKVVVKLTSDGIIIKDWEKKKIIPPPKKVVK